MGWALMTPVLFEQIHAEEYLEMKTVPDVGEWREISGRENFKLENDLQIK